MPIRFVTWGHNNRYTANLTSAVNDITGNLLFADEELRLSSDSPAIDAGTSAGAPSVDFDGRIRPSGSGVDIVSDEL